MKAIPLPLPLSRQKVIPADVLEKLNARLGKCDACGAQAVGCKRDAIVTGVEYDAKGQPWQTHKPGEKLTRYCAQHKPKEPAP